MSTHDQTPGEPGDDLTHESSQLDGVGSVERYVRLQEYIERILQNQRPSTAEHLPAEDADAYRMAAFLRGASPDAGEPDPDFVARLQARILAGSETREDASPPPSTAAPQPIPQPIPQPAAEPSGRERRRRAGVSRRALLGTGFGAAAAAVGVAAGMEIERLVAPSVSPQAHTTQLVPHGLGVWTAIATVESIPVGSVRRFETDFVVGFVQHTPDGFSALSGTCTHMGCLLLWNATDRTFDCPCHGGRFTEQGKSAPSSTFAYSPLPPIETKVENGQVWVYVIPPDQSSSGSEGGGSNAAGTETPTRTYP
jgi:cytochrome b6-f complex iron-sulfur subunit